MPVSNRKGEKMRKCIALGALLSGLVLATAARAQSFGNMNNVTPASRMANTSTNISPTTWLGSPFRLRGLINRFIGFSNRSTLNTTTLPAPGSKAYFDAFGYKTVPMHR